ncbi:hypothetical protein [Occallatibacter savannae]|uniref:hypothetical protein n=1 Tax=Occallatibacter savannae TaxID=1002691 RepID=UPI000D6908F2|nr:hypothetical protein [Occallatibacter savannae]
MICPYCSQGDVAIEIFGFTVHKLADRWIACPEKGSCSPFYDGVIATREEDASRPLPPARVAINSPARPLLTGTHSR